MQKPFIIAEAGINHNGDIRIATQLIEMAKRCGADAVKFQKRDIDTVYTKEFLDSARESPWGTTQRHQKEGLEFGLDEYREIDRVCKLNGIPWFASAWDLKSQEFLRQFDLPYNKVASAMLTHKPLLEMIAEERKFTFISTGMSNYAQIYDAIAVFDRYDTPICLMHCVSLYPCPDKYCNILAMKALQEHFGRSIGYSGHELGILPSVLAVAYGADAIERHVTIDRGMYGSDQGASLEERGLHLLVRDCRGVYEMLGTGVKTIVPEEEQVALKLRYWKE